MCLGNGHDGPWFGRLVHRMLSRNSDPERMSPRQLDAKWRAGQDCRKGGFATSMTGQAWHDMLTVFRALGGTADNICLCFGVCGCGFFLVVLGWSFVFFFFV